MCFGKLAFACLFAYISFCTEVHPQISAPSSQCIRIKQKCKPNLKQTKWGVKIGGIDFKTTPVAKIGEIQVGTDLIQQMIPVAQILDQMQNSRCQQLNALTTCDAVRQRILFIQAVTEAQIYNLALLVQAYSTNAAELKEPMLKWILQSGDLIQKIASNQFMSTDADIQKRLDKANEAMNYALEQLKIGRGSPEMQRILGEDLVRDQALPR